MFDYGELRLVVLAMIAEQPRHGYELMRAIEERMGGSYSPSPGVIYPTLSWLEDMGYAAGRDRRSRAQALPHHAGGKSLPRREPRVGSTMLLTRIGSAGKDGRYDGVPAPVVRGMENLKLALRLRLRRGSLDQAAAESIAAALDIAAQA